MARYIDKINENPKARSTKRKSFLPSKNFVYRLCYISLISIYILYLFFVITTQRGPIDYHTFMEIGRRFLAGGPIYGVNSYYPMPYVMIFAGLAWLPQWLSLLLWLSLPLVAMLLITRGSIWALTFAPMFAHFVGGQTALPGMLGVWGYRKFYNRFSGGLWLSLTTLKPQLAIFPVAWALWEWVHEWRGTKKIPAACKGFAAGITVLYLPGFIIYPTWPIDWLANARPLYERAMAGFLPRTLLLFRLPSAIFWLLLGLITILLFLAIYRKLDFKSFLLSSFVVSPLVHDYDLIQIIPLLETRQERILAVLLSLPTWYIIAFAYTIDQAWYVVTFIPLGLLLNKYLYKPAIPRPVST